MTTTIRIKTYEEQLVEVQEAITAILTGAQEASYNNQKVRKADLSALQAREEYLQKQIALKKRGIHTLAGGKGNRIGILSDSLIERYIRLITIKEVTQTTAGHILCREIMIKALTGTFRPTDIKHIDDGA